MSFPDYKSVIISPESQKSGSVSITMDPSIRPSPPETSGFGSFAVFGLAALSLSAVGVLIKNKNFLSDKLSKIFKAKKKEDKTTEHDDQ